MFNLRLSHSWLYEKILVFRLLQLGSEWTPSARQRNIFKVPLKVKHLSWPGSLMILVFDPPQALPDFCGSLYSSICDLHCYAALSACRKVHP